MTPSEGQLQRSNTAESSKAKTRPKVSWEAMPLANGRKCRNQPNLACLQTDTDTQMSAPLRMAPMAANYNSGKPCGEQREASVGPPDQQSAPAALPAPSCQPSRGPLQEKRPKIMLNPHSSSPSGRFLRAIALDLYLIRFLQSIQFFLEFPDPLTQGNFGVFAGSDVLGKAYVLHNLSIFIDERKTPIPDPSHTIIWPDNPIFMVERQPFLLFHEFNQHAFEIIGMDGFHE